MLKFLKKKSPLPRANPKLELVSVHIPKTAGTSFRHVLKRVYGEEAVRRLDIPILGQHTRINEQLYEEATLPYGTRVVHGHFSPERIAGRFAESEGVPHITWLRDPVERVISNYFYLAKRLAEELDEETKGLNILSKMQRSLLEYAQDEKNRNRQSKFLAGMALEDFVFVGIQEHLQEELVELGKILHWPPQEMVEHNRTGQSKQTVSDELRAEIAALNQIDVELYQRALVLRKERMRKRPVELISLHLPKTGGTSFYDSLKQVYGRELSIPYRRGNINRALERYGSLATSLPAQTSVVHGHLHYSEVKEVHLRDQSKVICWLREPIDRVISNYLFFIAGLREPIRNRKNYELNKHRKNEDIFTYARRAENRDVITRFLAGIEIEELFFVGFLENYEADLKRLGKMLDWPEGVVPVHLNQRSGKVRHELYEDLEIREEIRKLNPGDVMLYGRAEEIQSGLGL
ncbi:MAG: sulfotransferase family 2 domain-containing protein [Bacteroidota bacterium]